MDNGNVWRTDSHTDNTVVSLELSRSSEDGYNSSDNSSNSDAGEVDGDASYEVDNNAKKLLRHSARIYSSLKHSSDHTVIKWLQPLLPSSTISYSELQEKLEEIGCRDLECLAQCVKDDMNFLMSLGFTDEEQAVIKNLLSASDSSRG